MRSRSWPCVVVAGRHAKTVGPCVMAQGAYLPFTLLPPPIKVDQAARFRRCGSPGMEPCPW